jgi:hypothetical protein
MMILNPTAMITILNVTAPVLLLILFLPAIIELKKPKDRGPRMIMAKVPEVTLSLVHVMHSRLKQWQRLLRFYRAWEFSVFSLGATWRFSIDLLPT